MEISCLPQSTKSWVRVLAVEAECNFRLIAKNLLRARDWQVIGLLCENNHIKCYICEVAACAMALQKVMYKPRPSEEVLAKKKGKKKNNT